MSLSLKITSYQRLTPSQQAVYNAESDSFTIGRNHENDWAIPDPQRFLSGVHCRIHKEGDGYRITDTSTNGVFLNGSEERLTRNESVDLRAGDKFRIGDYEFEVIIEDASLQGNPLTSDEETMVGADPFDSPYSAQETPKEPDPFATSDPFADDDPFSTPESSGTTPDAEDDFLKDVNKPLTPMDDGPLGSHVSIDSLMGFDDDDMDLQEQDSVDQLKQRHSPLNEAFEPANPTTPAPPKTRSESDAGSQEEFPDNWDEATGMFIIPDLADSTGSADPTDFPDNWDETTGLVKVPEPLAPEPERAKPAAPKPEAELPPEPDIPEPVPSVPEPKPSEPAPKPVAPTPKVTAPAAKSPAAVPSEHSGDAMAAFARGAGLELEQLTKFDQEVLFEQVGRMLIMFTEGLIQTLGGRTHIKSEFRLDQTMIRPAENNPFKFSTSKTRTLLQLLSKSDPAYKSGVNAISEGFDDVNAHQMSVVAGMEAALQDILHRFNPKTLETRIVSDSILDNILPGGKKAKYWDIFRLLFDEIAGEAEDDFQQLFGREFSRAYEDQLNRLKNTPKE